jgi:hypothetical protein
VTSVPAAIVLLVLSLALASAILFTMALHAEEWKGVNYILRIISTNKGVASLSQAPIMLWTLVVAGASIYVMVLSGKLISVSSGTRSHYSASQEGCRFWIA